MDINIWFLLLPLAFYIGWRVSQAIMLAAFLKILEELKITNEHLLRVAQKQGLVLPETPLPPDLPELEVRLEQIGNEIYAYSVEGDCFLGQGRDRDSLIQRLTENLSDVRVIISAEHGAELIYTKP